MTDPISKYLSLRFDPEGFIQALAEYGYRLRCSAGIFHVRGIHSEAAEYPLQFSNVTTPSVALTMRAVCIEPGQSKWFKPIRYIHIIDWENRSVGFVYNISCYRITMTQEATRRPIEIEFEFTLRFP